MATHTIFLGFVRIGHLQAEQCILSPGKAHKIKSLYFSYTSLFLPFTKEIAYDLKTFTQTLFASLRIFPGLFPDPRVSSTLHMCKFEWP
jgi:hypothetical protein